MQPRPRRPRHHQLRILRGRAVAWLHLLTGRTQGPWWWRLAAAQVLLVALAVLVACAWTLRISETLGTTRPEALGHARASSVGANTPATQTQKPSAPIDAGSGPFFGSAPSATGDRTSAQANATLAELCKTLKLQGILGGANPQAILVELATKQTHYLSAGQFLGQIRVREVRQTSVIVEWNKETMEISL
jgi:hypothetical protein